MLFPSRRNSAGKPDDNAAGLPAARAAARPVLFDGRTDKILPFDGHLGLATFTLDVRLVSAGFPDELPALTDTTPAMPFRIGSTITCQTAPGGYIVSLREAGKDIAKATISGLYGSTRITVVSSAEGCVVFGNGAELVRVGKPVVLDSAARVGAGFLKRFWEGEIEYLDVFGKAMFASAFDGASDRLPADHRIATLQD